MSTFYLKTPSRYQKLTDSVRDTVAYYMWPGDVYKDYEMTLALSDFLRAVDSEENASLICERDE